MTMVEEVVAMVMGGGVLKTMVTMEEGVEGMEGEGEILIKSLKISHQSCKFLT